MLITTESGSTYEISGKRWRKVGGEWREIDGTIPRVPEVGIRLFVIFLDNTTLLTSKVVAYVPSRI